MNIILFRSDELDGDHLCLDDERFEHIASLLTPSPGDVLRVGEINGLMGDGTVESITDSDVRMQVSLGKAPPDKLPLTLVVALPRPKMLRRILRNCAELGVEKLVLINAAKVEKSFWQTPVLQERTIEQYLFRGLEQSVDTVPPTIQLAKRFRPFVEDELPALLKESTGLVAHPGQDESCDKYAGESLLVAIGPEGGWTTFEVDLLKAAGCIGVNLGPRILRVENAVTSVIAKLSP